MSEKEFLIKERKLKDRHRRELEQFWWEYARANSVYKKGDIVTDHYHSIKIDRITITIDHGIPKCVYTGLRIKKDGSVFKNKEISSVYQCNVVGDSIAI